MVKQICKDCDGDGAIPTEDADYGLVHLTCQTCTGYGDMDRTGPYRLADGTWSDGVDRRIEIHDRIPPQNRWQVYQCESGYWEACAESDGQQLDEIDSFPTHAEAIAYADRMARGGA